MNILKEDVIDLLYSAEEYSVILENLDIIEKAFSMNSCLIINESSDQKAVVRAAEKYIEDVKDFLDKTKDKKQRADKLSKILALISSGGIILSGLMTLATGSSIVLPMAVSVNPMCVLMISLIMALISAAIGVISLISRNESKKLTLTLNQIKRRLIIHKKRIKNVRVEEKLNDLIDKIDSSLGKVREVEDEY